MDTFVVLLLLACGSAVLGWCGVTVAEDDDSAHAIVSMEREALTRWGQGDPSGFLEISAPEVTYLDPSREQRLDGLAALTRHHEALRGLIHVDRFELEDPHVALHQGMAVLTFDYCFLESARSRRRHCTEVYRKLPEGWRIVHTHWSQPVASQ